jgi:hypothetical protein
VAATCGLLIVHRVRDPRRGEHVVPTDLEAFERTTGGPVAIGGAS